MSKSSSQSVQLFPFLAVLICAMGALILLLLVATRRIKHVAVQKATKARAAKIAESVRRETAQTETLEAAPAFLPQLVSISAHFDPDISARKAEELRAEWRKTVEELSQTYADEVRTLAAIRAEAIQKEQADNKERTALETERQRLVIRKQELEASRAEMSRDETRLTSEAAATDDAARRTKKAVQIKAEELANQPVPYTLLPYDGQLGTIRRPIIIECDDRSITFVCEGVTLTAPQLSGFPSDFNPVLAGTRALFEYWSVKDRQNASLKTPPPPYVLLVVRPRGTIAFYVARKLLEQFDQPYGYELVTDELELTWPASEDRARTVCRDAVDRVLKERERIASGLQGQRFPVANELRYDNEQGLFVTEEVEHLRAIDDSVVVGGQRWKREAGPGGEAPGAFQSASSGPGGPGGPGASGSGGPGGNASGGSGTPGAPGRPSPSSYREFSSTFQGSSGPRLAGSPSGTGTGGSGRRSGALHPFPEYESNSAAPVVPQGTGPIAAPRQPGGGYSRGPGGRSSGGAGGSSSGSGASTPGAGSQLAGGPGPYPGPGTGAGTGNGAGNSVSGGSGTGIGPEAGSPSVPAEAGGPGYGPTGTEGTPGNPGYGLVGEGGNGTNALGPAVGGPARQSRQGQGGGGSGASGPGGGYGGQGAGGPAADGAGGGSGGGGGGLDPFAEGAGAAAGSGRAAGPAQLSPDGLWADRSEFSRGSSGSGSGSAAAPGSSRVPGEFGPEGLFEEDGLAPGGESGTAMRGTPGSRGSGGQPGGFDPAGTSQFGGPSNGFAPGPGSGAAGSGGGGQGTGSAGAGGSGGGGGGGAGGAPGFGSRSDPGGPPGAGGVPVYGAAPGGRSSPGRGSRSGSAPEGMPVSRNLRSIGQDGPSNGETRERRWGDPEHSGVIALERTVTIHIREDGVLLEDEPEISLKNGTAYRELKDRLSHTLDHHVSQWGRPPASFYWLPNVTFRIHPGGNQYYQALKTLTDEWGIHSTSEQVLE